MSTQYTVTHPSGLKAAEPALDAQRDILWELRDLIDVVAEALQTRIAPTSSWPAEVPRYPEILKDVAARVGAVADALEVPAIENWLDEANRQEGDPA